MSGLKQLRNRVKSIVSTKKITKAMHIVSAAKLKKIKDRASCLNDFSHILSNIMRHIITDSNLSNISDENLCFFSKDLMNLPHLLVVMTSERGLCGSFNSTIIKQVKADLIRYKKEQKSVKLIIIGKKGIDTLKHKYPSLIDTTYNIQNANYECVSNQVKNRIIELVQKKQVGSCFMYYNRFKNAITQVFEKEQILPAKLYEENNTDDVFEFEGENLVHNIINLYIQGELSYGLLQNRAGEEGARMTAMDNSTKNATELIDKLSIKLNRSRQAIITTELTEIVSGAEAL